MSNPYYDIAQQAHDTAVQRQGDIQTEMARRQAILNQITAAGPQVIQYVCEWAMSQGFTEETLQQWLHNKTFFFIEVQAYYFKLFSNGRIELPKMGPVLYRPATVVPRRDNDYQHGNLPNMTETAVQEFMNSAVQELAKDFTQMFA